MTDSNYTPPIPTQPEYSELTNDAPWSFRGRFSRLSFLAWSLVSGLVFAVIFFILIGSAAFSGIQSGNPFGNLGFGTLIAAGLLYIAILAIGIIFAIRRIHDLDLSGWWILLAYAFLPGSLIAAVTTPIISGIALLASFVFWIYILVAPGTKGPNRFGPQRVTPGWEVVVGWIYIALVLLGIVLAAFSIPAYKGYIERAQQKQAAAQSQYSESSSTEATATATDSYAPSATTTESTTTTTTTESITAPASAS